MRRGSTALASLRPPEAAQVLAWLYACGDVAGHEVLGYLELSDRADEVMRFLARQEIPLPAEVCRDVCPDWHLGR
jgi:hypothetical protein